MKILISEYWVQTGLENMVKAEISKQVIKPKLPGFPIQRQKEEWGSLMFSLLHPRTRTAVEVQEVTTSHMKKHMNSPLVRTWFWQGSRHRRRNGVIEHEARIGIRVLGSGPIALLPGPQCAQPDTARAVVESEGVQCEFHCFLKSVNTTHEL